MSSYPYGNGVHVRARAREGGVYARVLIVGESGFTGRPEFSQFCVHNLEKTGAAPLRGRASGYAWAYNSP